MTSHKHISEAMAYLGAAIAQTIPSDDQIIADDVRAALRELRAVDTHELERDHEDAERWRAETRKAVRT